MGGKNMSAPLKVTRAGAEEELRQALRSEKKALNQNRIRAVYSVALGKKIPEVAKSMLLSERAVRNWVHWYEDEGVNGLWDGRTGRKCRLGEKELELLKRKVLSGPKAREEKSGYIGEDVQRILKEEYGVLYSLDGVYYLMHNQLNLSHIKPRPAHRKARPEEQDAFKKSSPNWSPI